jgi:DDE family transposase
VLTEDEIASRWTLIRLHLDERQRRVWLGIEAVAWGEGGISAIARATDTALKTVRRGRDELADGAPPDVRTRKPGGGRRKVEDLAPDLVPTLEALVAPGERGDPTQPLRWTTDSVRDLADKLAEHGHDVSASTVGRLLHEAGYSLQANVKVLEGREHPDRDAQFIHINDTAAQFLAAGDPVVSVDTKKKEVVGEYANKGQAWRPEGEPTKVSTHDFPGPLGKAIPYGVYDIGANTGWVSVGSDHDTAAFAVNTLRGWWNDKGQAAYPNARRLMITADGGGSNGYRLRAWKVELAKLAAETGLTITVSHYPPGTSKWNRIEHRLFSAIAMNWSGHPLTSHEVVIDLIGSTTTRTGLTVHAERDTGTYPTGIKISSAEMSQLPISRDEFHGEWNYVLHPEQPTDG